MQGFDYKVIKDTKKKKTSLNKFRLLTEFKIKVKLRLVRRL